LGDRQGCFTNVKNGNLRDVVSRGGDKMTIRDIATAKLQELPESLLQEVSLLRNALAEIESFTIEIEKSS
jgi:hypothetical protein